jgi:hypothetical protein
MTSPVTDTPPAHGSSICFVILLHEWGLKIGKCGVNMDVGVAGFEFMYQYLYDNFNWHQGVGWVVRQLADRKLNGLWLAILTNCLTNPACLPQSLDGGFAYPFNKIEYPSTKHSDVPIAGLSEMLAGMRARRSKLATRANNNSAGHSHNYKYLPSGHFARLQDDAVVESWLETGTYSSLPMLAILRHPTISAIGMSTFRTTTPNPDGFNCINTFQFALENTMYDAPEYHSDGMNDIDKEPPKITDPATKTGIINQIDNISQAVRQLQ